MATDARFSCPVCSEPYDAPPAECFRCETPLGSWWRFEDAVARSEPAGRSPRIGPVAIALVLGPLIGAVAFRMAGAVATPPAPTATVATIATTLPPPPQPAATPSPLAPRVVTYRVQPGDSLWRIAAALTGDGRNWKALWPSTDPSRPLTVGAALEVPTGVER